MRVWEAAQDLAWGQACAGCNRPGRLVCEACSAALGREQPRRLHGHPLVVTAHEYAHPVRGMLVAYKERGSWSLAPLLSLRLALAVASVWDAAGWEEPLTLVPVPSRASVVRARGLDTTWRLCRGAAGLLRRATGIAVCPRRALHIVGAVRDQADLTADERARNVAGVYEGASPSAGIVCIVDDIRTTGATLTEARRAALAAGWNLAGAAVVAAAVLRGGGASMAGP